MEVGMVGMAHATLILTLMFYVIMADDSPYLHQGHH
jgi:hypothetical protein